MPMFYTPKPRQFHYTPRFYNPDKEKWEELKKKYGNRQTADGSPHDKGADQTATNNDDLAYFEQKVQEIEADAKRQNRKLGVRDLFHRREMPKFNYQPRFQQYVTASEADATADEAVLEKYESETVKNRKIKIRRRFDIGDTEYLKPVPGGKIMLYTLLACLLLYFILF